MKKNSKKIKQNQKQRKTTNKDTSNKNTARKLRRIRNAEKQQIKTQVTKTGEQKQQRKQ